MKECIFCGKEHEDECRIEDLKLMIIQLLNRLYSESSRADEMQVRGYHACGEHCNK